MALWFPKIVVPWRRIGRLNLTEQLLKKKHGQLWEHITLMSAFINQMSSLIKSTALTWGQMMGTHWFNLFWQCHIAVVLPMWPKKKSSLTGHGRRQTIATFFFFIVSTSHLFNLTCVQCHELDTLSALCVMEGLNIHNWTWTWTSLSTAGPSRQSPWEDQLVAANTQNTMNSLNYVHINILCIY